MNYFIYRSEHEWLGHSGLAMYDNTARLHDPLLDGLSRLFAPRRIANRPRFHLAYARQNGPTFAKRLDELADARFSSPDPLYAKFGPLSPWSHCAADPLNHFDPDGRDIFRLEQDGSFTLWDMSHKNDLIIAENGDKITLKHGTINSGENGHSKALNHN